MKKNYFLQSKSLVCWLMLFFSISGYAQNTWYVNDTNTTGDIYTTAVGEQNTATPPADTGTGTSSDPFLRLKTAVAAASSGDTIYVDAGTYDEENISFNKSLTIIGAGMGSTKFKADHLASDTTPFGPSGVNYRFGTITSSNVVIKNISITKYALNGTGGNVFRIDGALTGIVLESVMIYENRGTANGLQNIVIVGGANVHIKKSFFKCAGYSAANGGGIQVNSSTLTIDDSVLFESEGSGQDGGAISISGTAPSVTVNNCTFYENHAKRGGAIGIASGTLTVNNSCFDNNNIVGSSPASSDGGGAFFISGGNATFNHCSFKNNCVGSSGGCATSATPRGGAVFISGGTTNLNNCEFENNSGGRGTDIHRKNGGTVNINTCYFRTIYPGTSTSNATSLNVYNEDGGASTVNWSDSGTPTANSSGVAVTKPETAGTITTTNTNNPSGTINSNCVNPASISSCGSAAPNCATETVAPIILRCVENKIVQCKSLLLDYTAEVSAYDDCTFTVTQLPLAGTILAIGVPLTVTMTVTDQNGNSSTCIFTVTASAAAPTYSNFGNFASAVRINKNGTNEVFDLSGVSPNLISGGSSPNNFHNVNLGTYNQNSTQLVLNAAELKSWKTSSGNACNPVLLYTVYTTGARPAAPTFTSLNIPFKDDCGWPFTSFPSGGPCNERDQKWSNIGGSLFNVELSNRPAGNYTIELYIRQDGNNSGTSGCSNQIFIDNSCNNFTANFILGGCSIKTWTSSGWSSAGEPTTSNEVVIDADFNTNTLNKDINCCKLTVNAGKTLTITSNRYAHVINEVINNGTFTIENNGSLIQVDNTKTNTGNITYKRTATAIKGYDYIYWSSPVTGQDISTIYTNSPVITQGPKYVWNPIANNSNGTGGNQGQGAWQAASGSMSAAKGYIIRGSSDSNMTATDINAEFVGVPRNGNITYSLERGGFTGTDYVGANNITTTKFDDNHNLIGNPYPSAISAKAFINANAYHATNNTTGQLLGTVKLWQHGFPLSSSNASPFYGFYASNYNANDYLTINSAGTLPYGGSEIIKSGQGFFVTMVDGAAVNTSDNKFAVFNNDMRLDSGSPMNNSGFFRMATESTNTKSRMWLDLVNTQNNSCLAKTMIAYINDATNGYESIYDAINKFSTSEALYSKINNELFEIQARAPFVVTDQVPLALKIINAGSYALAINAVDGLFLNNQTIYVKDNLLNTVHNLSQNPYVFASVAGEIQNRFEIVYQTNLKNEDFNNNNVNIFIDNFIHIQSKENIENIEIYDMLGKLVKNYSNINSHIWKDNFNFANGVYIVKLKTTNNKIISQKVIK